ncbi:uncharacterized protein LOC142765778 [Rhipicephalus microplus]|uniref:uncharacterized protein LOC142765778 n=1 Tax=Rhipicephalus microplus TaxID=6941 RepID=UPI003F6AB061
MAAISREKDGNNLAKRVARKLHVVQQTGCDVSLHWIPSHTGIPGNKVADCAATVAHDPNTGGTIFVCSADAGCLLTARYWRECHTNPRVAAGKPPRTTKLYGINQEAFIESLTWITIAENSGRTNERCNGDDEELERKTLDSSRTSATTMVHQQLTHFDDEKDNWKVYVIKAEAYFEATGVTESAKKRALLVAALTSSETRGRVLVVNEGETDEGVDDSLHIWTLRSTREETVKPPIRRNLTWGGVDVSILIDTGSPVCVVSRQVFEQHKNAWPPLKPSRIELSCYLGKLPVLGEILLPVSYVGATVECPLVVLDCCGPRLCGRDLIFLLSDAGSPVFGLSAEPPTAQPSTNTQVFPDVISEFADVLSSELGLIKGPAAHLQLKMGVTPKFQFILVTDHQPVLGLLRSNRPTPPLAAARIQCWALYLGGFCYKLHYSLGKSSESDEWTLAPDTNVYIRNFGKGEKWKTGTVKSADGARIVTVETPEGLVRRHVDYVHTRRDSAKRHHDT